MTDQTKPTSKNETMQYKPCPATTTYNHIRIQCNKIEGHPGEHSTWAKILWEKGTRTHADIDLHAHLADCKCFLCTDPTFQKIKQQELARRGKA